MGGCLRCGRCCTSFGVCITPFDILRLSRASGLGAESFAMAIPEPPERERTEPAVLVNGEPSLIVLRWAGPPERKCIFYSGAGCSVYDCRPMLCRTYPFKTGQHGGLLKGMKSRACPRAWKPTNEAAYAADNETYSRELSIYREIAEEWNRAGGGTLMGFLDFAAKKAAGAPGISRREGEADKL